MRKIYTTDLSDAEWACLKNHLPASKLPGKMRTHALREIFYVLRSGCSWRLLPSDFPPWQTVFYHFRKFRLSGLWFLVLKSLRAAERKRNGKDPNPSAAIVDSQSIKTTEESASRDGHEAHRKGYDAHKHVKGRKRHLLVDTLGLPLSVCVTPAGVQDRVGARCLLAGLKPLVPRLKKIWADGAYGSEPLSKWCQDEGAGSLRSSDATRTPRASRSYRKDG